MSVSRRFRRSRLAVVLAVLFAVVTVVSPATAVQRSAAKPGAPKPTIVLVHGAFADASGWSGVIERLQRRGYQVIAPANPLRDLSDDADYVSSVLSTISGPVVLVGHSYGGAVVTNAAREHPNVKALVYVAAFALDEGETVFGIVGSFPGSELAANILPRAFPGGIDAYVNPSAFHRVFAGDLPAKTANVLAASQRPATLASGEEPSGSPAWSEIPSWYLIAGKDKVIPPSAQRFMADRADARTRTVNSSHVAMISHPDAVTTLILDAAR
ncbi:alpha/beta hydrolase [Prauserella marina]|uniref:Pimeloyl-ACP methyl ester carboxylesterase n=1 Tax=Prauserella marina TaxID=530584 RepID=A0A222VX25_9PSEU|nr:alpha/beta hydrolase [Prauserella marina]ASR38467.1 alpha/beta hydrolase [Prauserella marina]PWV78289.1 pimeloyl-ACP methyl ester carboxylesterase [Prauserella marina]SDC82651.1 Pimeloyl-ACP methyl ester carboxylesterase [Prauserella marina]